MNLIINIISLEKSLITEVSNSIKWNLPMSFIFKGLKELSFIIISKQTRYYYVKEKSNNRSD